MTATTKLAAVGNIVRHIKSRGIYRVIGLATQPPRSAIEDPNEHLVLYSNLLTGKVWARPLQEFEDGRFEKVAQHTEPPATEEQGDAFTDGYFTALADKENRV